MVGLQRQLVQRRQQLGDGAHRVVGHVDTVHDAERHDLGVEAGPQPGLGDLVTAAQLQVVDARDLAEQQLQPRVAHVGAADAERAQVASARLEVAGEVRHVLVRRPEKTHGVEAALLDAVVHSLQAGRAVAPALTPRVTEGHDRHGVQPVLGVAVQLLAPLAAHLAQHAALGRREAEEEPGQEPVVHHQVRDGVRGARSLLHVRLVD